MVEEKSLMSSGESDLEDKEDLGPDFQRLKVKPGSFMRIIGVKAFRYKGRSNQTNSIESVNEINNNLVCDYSPDLDVKKLSSQLDSIFNKLVTVNGFGEL